MDRYLFDFLELGEAHSERQLEKAHIGRVEDFLCATDGMSAFMRSQYRQEIDGKEFFIDLLLFHRRLRAMPTLLPNSVWIASDCLYITTA